MKLRDFVESRVRRSNRFTLVIVLLLAIPLIFGIITSLQFWLRFLGTPTPMTAGEVIDTPADTIPLINVQITAERVLDNAGTETSTKNGATTTTGYYSAMVLDDRLLLLKTSDPIDIKRLQYSGTLRPISAGTKEDIVDAIVRDQPSLKGVFLTLMLESPGDSSPWLGGLLVMALAGTMELVLLSVYINRRMRPGEHIAMKGLARYGDPYRILVEINDEMPPDSTPRDGLQFTPNWLIFANGPYFDVMRLVDIVWIYQVNVRNGGAPTKHGFLIIVGRDSHTISTAKPMAYDTMPQVEVLMNQVARFVPWAIVGHSDDIQRAWKQRPHEVIAQVDKRRAEIVEQEQSHIQ